MIFDYLYCDAGNYKAFGSVLLTGALNAFERSELVACLHEGEFFVAEQIGVPPLYPILFEFCGGPSEDDHAWHRFEGFREQAEFREGFAVWGKASTLLATLRATTGKWQPELSPNFDCWSVGA